jgi:pilus assembly protein CpaC
MSKSCHPKLNSARTLCFAGAAGLLAILAVTLIDVQPAQAQSSAQAQAQAQTRTQTQARRAQQEQDESALVRRVAVTLHKSRTIRLDQPFEKAIVGAPDIVDALPTNNQTLYLQGKKAGTTNVSVFDNGGRVIEVIDVEVTIDAATLQDKIRAAAGSRGITVSSNNGQVVLGGEAVDAAAADRAVQISKAFHPDGQIVNTMRIAAISSQQVMLKVQFLETARSAGRELGINWYNNNANAAGNRGFSAGTDTPSVTTGTSGVPLFGAAANMFGTSTAPFGVVLANLVNRGGTSIDMMVSALETQGLVRRLAEPTLIALSGDSASFLAGGEIPVPTPSVAGASPTIEWKPFGVQLGFMPTVLANGVINLRLAPSVSELDYANKITISGAIVPAVTKREAKTTVELRDGQSFAIAGLLQAGNRRDIAQLPWIGSVPVLGALFRSSAFQQNETDLVVIVTPHLVAPATPDQHLASPLDQRLPSNDLDFFLLGQMEVRKRYNDYVSGGGQLTGPYGHMIGGE